MPKNKSALIRYRVINRCLVEKIHVSKKELREACERALDIYPIGDRTIDSDIHTMRYDERLGYNAPIKFDRAKGTYYYDDKNYSIDNIPLSEEELDSLVFASKLLDQFKEVGIFKNFRESVNKLIDAISIYRNIKDKNLPVCIEFEKVNEATGTEYIDPVINALINKTVLRIEYKKFTTLESSFHTVHPYLLKQYRNRWYLVGYNEKYKEIRTYSLDRFSGIQSDHQTNFIDTDFEANKYYDNVIGISITDEEPVEIQIAFSEIQAQYVITQPLHHSQKRVEEITDKIVFKYKLVPNFEFYARILGWGNEVEVLSPLNIREGVQKIAARILSKYQPKSK